MDTKLLVISKSESYIQGASENTTHILDWSICNLSLIRQVVMVAHTNLCLIFFKIGSVTIMTSAGAKSTFAFETFLLLVNLIATQIIWLISYYDGIMLLWVENWYSYRLKNLSNSI